jgi:hypothetical protein
MKTKFLPFLLLLIAINSFSQNAQQLLSGTKKLFTANYEMDFEAIVSLSYPKMVETIGKDVMLDKLDKCYQNDEFRLRYQLESVPFITHKTQKIGALSFCMITCRNPVRYFFEKKLTTEEATTKIPWLQETNHTKDVVFEPNSNSFNVKRNTTFLAVMDETTSGDWKFINLDDTNQAAAFESLFDEIVKKQLGLTK